MLVVYTADSGNLTDTFPVDGEPRGRGRGRGGGGRGGGDRGAPRGGRRGFDRHSATGKTYDSWFRFRLSVLIFDQRFGQEGSPILGWR